MSELLDDYTDAHKYNIYHSYNSSILSYSRNDTAYNEVFGNSEIPHILEHAGIDGLLDTLAYYAFRQDIQDKIEEIEGE